jgi:hypothetical protein
VDAGADEEIKGGRVEKARLLQFEEETKVVLEQKLKEKAMALWHK